MRVLITGAEGQLGRALLRVAPGDVEISPISRADCDLTDSAMLRARLAVEAPDIILNTAAYTAVDRAESEEALATTVNSDAVAVMVEAMRETGGRLVHISTDFVFDGLSSQAYTPGDQRNPLSAYGRSKAAGEDQLRENDLCVRTAWLYDAGRPNFVRTMLRLMRERDEVGVVADQIGAPTWATGLAKTIWGLVENQANGIFHYSDAGVASWYDFAVAIAEEAHEIGLLDRVPLIHPISTTDYPTPAKRPRFSLLDSRATLDLLGKTPAHWRGNLRRMLKEEKALG